MSWLFLLLLQYANLVKINLKLIKVTHKAGNYVLTNFHFKRQSDTGGVFSPFTVISTANFGELDCVIKVFYH